MPFQLPANLNPSLTADMELQHPSGTSKSKVIAVVAESVYCFKSYPTTPEYEHVAQEMIKRWPCLAKGSSVVSWKINDGSNINRDSCVYIYACMAFSHFSLWVNHSGHLRPESLQERIIKTSHLVHCLYFTYFPLSYTAIYHMSSC